MRQVGWGVLMFVGCCCQGLYYGSKCQQFGVLCMRIAHCPSEGMCFVLMPCWGTDSSWDSIRTSLGVPCLSEPFGMPLVQLSGLIWQNAKVSHERSNKPLATLPDARSLISDLAEKAMCPQMLGSLFDNHQQPMHFCQPPFFPPFFHQLHFHNPTSNMHLNTHL